MDLDHMDELVEETMSCPVCEGPAMLLGTLGARLHVRCRNCGLGFSRTYHLPADEAEAHAAIAQDVKESR
jgi:hypothetical protein